MFDRCHTSVSMWLALLVAAPLIGGCQPASDGAPELVYLNGTPDFDRAAIYHQDEGIRLFPYEWFLALEQRHSDDLFGSADNIRRYAFLPDTRNDAANPDRLPVGFTKYDPAASTIPPDDEFACDGASGAPAPPPLSQLGFNCAACHTGQLHFTHPSTGRRYLLHIDGGPSMQNNLKFFMDLRDVLKETVQDEQKWNRFVGRLSKRQATQALASDELRACVVRYLEKRRSESYNGVYPNEAAMFPSPWGFGRLDALGRGGNTLFGKFDPDNLRPANAPVSIPPLWNTVWSYDKVQWNGAIHDFRARYIGQAIGLNAWVRLKGDRTHLFESTLDMEKLNRLVDRYKELPPPSWPSDIFAAPRDEAGRATLAAQGKTLYKNLCAGCHVPATKNGDRYTVHMIGLSVIGTDPASATNFFDRTVKTGGLNRLLKAETLPAVKIAEFLTTKIMEKNGLRDVGKNKWTARLAYIARPHVGVWATAPFLHNGSIPTLYLLLSPQEERDAQAKAFCLGDLEFDPEQVGFQLKRPPCAADESLFDTTLPGNRNTGHEFRSDDRAGRRFSPSECEDLTQHAKNGILGCRLDRAERLALVEYLKTCDLWRYPDAEWKAEEEPVKACPAK